MDWDKLRIFQAAADAGSFTHAGELMGLSQSAISRQVSALEQDLGTPLFHRHARGLILTEQGELLLGAVQDVVLKLEAARSRLIDSRDKPHGELRVTTTLGFGANWLTPRLGEFLELYPEVKRDRREPYSQQPEFSPDARARCAQPARGGNHHQQYRRRDACCRTCRRHCRPARLLRRRGVWARAFAAPGGHARDGVLPGLSRRDEECRPRPGVPRLSRRQGAEVEILNDTPAG
jgi:DNA-binding transcriptional LysR family regulator